MDIDFKRKYRLLKVYYVPATRSKFLAYFLSFLLWPLTLLMRQTKQAVCTINQSIFLRCLCVWNHLQLQHNYTLNNNSIMTLSIMAVLL
jgi:hypothetical protein